MKRSKLKIENGQWIIKQKILNFQLSIVNSLLLVVLLLLAGLNAFAHGGHESFTQNHNEIKSDKVVIRTLGIQTKRIIEEDIDDVIKTTGQLEPIPNNEFEVNSPVQGRIRTIFVSLGDFVGLGQPLAQIESPEITKLSSEVNQSGAELELAKSTYEREKSLYEDGISAKKDFEAAKANLAGVEAKLTSAKNNLSILTGSLESSNDGVFNILSHKQGTITERNITVGQVVGSNQSLFKGINLSSIWASADIYEKDQNKVSLGQKVLIMLDGIPDKVFEGKINYIGSIVNNQTRTIPVKVTLQNPYFGTINKLSLRPGAFIQMAIHTGNKKKTIIIPRSALTGLDKEDVEEKHTHVLYVKKENKFIPREVEVESHDSDSVVVVSGLMSGEEIVVEGAYQLQYGKKDEDKIEKQDLISQGLHATPIQVATLIIITLVIGFFLGRRKKYDY